jgi:hypothetical protein
MEKLAAGCRSENGDVSMSMTLSFTQVTPAVLAKAKEDPEWADEYLWELDPTGEPDGYLDKAWAGIQFLLDTAGVPIDLRDDGEYLDEEGHLFGWSVHQVHEAAQRLRATPFEELARYYDPALMAEQDIYPGIWGRDDTALNYLNEYYEVLLRFFEATAAAQSAAIVSFSY